MSFGNAIRELPTWSPIERNAQLASRLLVGAGLVMIVLLVFALPYFGGVLPTLALIGLCLGVLVVVKPEIGVASIVVCAAVVRMSIGTGTDSFLVASLVVAVLAVCGWIVHRLIHRQPLLVLPWPIAAPALALSALTVFSFIWGRATLDPRILVPPTFYRVQIGQSLLIIVALALLFVGADIFRSATTRNLLACTVVAVGVFALPYRWLMETPPQVNTGGLFGLWFVAITWSMALVNHRLPRPVRIGLAGLTVAWMMMAFIKEGAWVSGWLPPLIAILGITVVARPKLGFASILIAGMAGIVYYASLYSLLITKQQEEGSLGGDFGRLELIKRNLELIHDQLLLGTGPAGYTLYYVTFLPDQSMSTHNNYVDILAQTGVLGIVSFVAVLVALFVLGRKALHRCRENPTDFAMAAAIVGALPGLAAGLFMGDWLIPFVYNQTIAGFDHAVYSWLMLAALCGLYGQYVNRGRSADG